MDIASLLLILALLIPTALFVLRPLFAHKATAVSETSRRTSALLAERERVLAALQELDFDNVVGKIPEDEYPARRAALLAEGVQILKQLDELNWTEEDGDRRVDGALEANLEAAVSRARRSDSDLEAALEAAIGAQRRTAAPAPPAPGPGVRPASPAAREACPNCGKPVRGADRFCARCGHALISVQEPA
ncbi:MAG: zinc ribbon domain-containing protein [Chloroflexi bacterium]|nr:zinc ribbon domain-containing protein [Chloroflexota bacterium]